MSSCTGELGFWGKKKEKFGECPKVRLSLVRAHTDSSYPYTLEVSKGFENR